MARRLDRLEREDHAIQKHDLPLQPRADLRELRFRPRRLPRVGEQRQPERCRRRPQIELGEFRRAQVLAQPDLSRRFEQIVVPPDERVDRVQLVVHVERKAAAASGFRRRDRYVRD